MSTFSAAFLRERFIGVFKVLFILVLFATGGVLLTFLPLKIPFTFQRTLSFLPGNWDQEAVLDAKGSTEWRLDMWKEVITSDRYIHNKILGDGFGLPRTDYEAQLSSFMTGVNAYEGKLAAQESFMINGDFHSGPLSLVRFVGVVGGALFLTLLFMMASYSYKLIEKSHGTPFEFCTLFVCIPLFVEPIFYLFIFGDFKAELPSTLYNIGFMNMISASITMYKNKEQKLKNNN
jgi:drug/metabolite transporter (DMT)-like permease